MTNITLSDRSGTKLCLISLKRSSFFNKKMYFFLGILTYPLYLIHQNIAYILMNYLNKYLLLFLIVSYLIYYFIDNIFSNYLKVKLSDLLLMEKDVK